ncbi:MAG: PDZ domain-containing protein [Akkermansia sp.]|nr:PDZ domain-containing protein [Akkermansia sp.]MBR2314553.1 PDZ domain-containing protein [Akkermansia sp.]
MMKRHTAILCLLLCCLTMLQVAGGAVVFGVVPAEKPSEYGVVVRRVAERTPAHEAGLRAGDEIVSVQGVPTPHASALKEVLRPCAPGDVLRVRYRRNKELRSALVELAARPAAEPVTAPAAPLRLSPEVQQQFAQARNRLRIQLARLPHRVNMQQVQADLQEMLILARQVPAGCSSWLQGADVQMSLKLGYPGGAVELQFRNGLLFLVTQEPDSGSQSSYPINTKAERAALPRLLIRRLQQY